MKKYHFIALAVCCGFLWACHKDGPTENPFADAPWAIDETLPVPIQVNAPQPDALFTTKADAITSMTGVRLNVIAYDLRENVTSMAHSAFLFNKILYATGGTTLQFTESDYASPLTYYYPNSGDIEKANPITNNGTDNKYNYTFFAYHLPDDATGVTTGFEEVEVNSVMRNDFVVSFPVNPTTLNTDVLVAKAQAANYTVDAVHADPADNTSDVVYPAGTYYGFNARYRRIARLKNDLAAHEPLLQFSHAMAQIVIKAVAQPGAYDTFWAYNDPDDPADGTWDKLTVKLEDILQANAHANVKLDVTKALDIANYTAPTASELVLSWDESSPEVTEPYELDTYAPAIRPCDPTLVDPNDPGYDVNVAALAGNLHRDSGFFVVPGTDAITIHYSLVAKNSPSVSSAPDTKEATLTVPDGGYLPGRTYTYTIRVASLEQLQVYTELASWTDGNSQFTNPNQSIITED
jgi:hypothetical protein